MAIEFIVTGKTFPVKYVDNFGNTLPRGAMTANVGYNGTNYIYSGCDITASNKYLAGTTEVPVMYNVGTTGTSWYGTAYVNGMSVLDGSEVCTSHTISGSLSGTFSFSSSEHPDSFSGITVSVKYESKRNISFQTTSVSRHDYANQPVITGKRNSPIGDSGADTSVTLKVKRHYKAETWTCGSKTCGWGETITATYNAEASYIELTGRLYRYDSTIETFLDTLPIPVAPKQSSTDTVKFQDLTSTPNRTEQQSVTRTKQYKFKNWNTAADGSGTIYGTGGNALASSGFLKNTILYAQWEDTTTTDYKVPTGWTTNKLEYVSGDPCKTATVKCFDRGTQFDAHTCNQYELKPMKFKHWLGNDGSTVAAGGPLGGASTYTAVFVIDSTATSQYKWDNNKFTPDVPFDRRGWTYVGLVKDTSSKIPDYAPEEEITITASMNLYTLWKANGSGHLFDGTNYKMYQIYIYDGSSWKLYIPKIYNGSNWDSVYM